MVTDDNFLNWYINEGFTKSSKRDIDIYAFYLICQINPEFLNKDLYEISKELKITQTKAKSYLNEIQIRFELLKEYEVATYLIETILNCSFSLDNNQKEIKLQINNPIVLEYLKFKLNSLFIVNDYGINQNIVKISFDNFADLINNILISSKKEKELKDKLIKLIQSNSIKILMDGVKDIISFNLADILKNLSIYIYDNRATIKDLFITTWKKQISK